MEMQFTEGRDGQGVKGYGGKGGGEGCECPDKNARLLAEASALKRFHIGAVTHQMSKCPTQVEHLK